jgi:hypothetical protein
MLRPRKKFIVAGGVVAGLMASGVAWAAWTADGTGAGYAEATTAVALTTDDVSATTVGQLYPGGSGDVKLTINNPNPYPVRVTSISGNGTITADAGHSGCTTTGVSFADQTGTWDVAANDETSVTLSGAASMSNASLNACQGATFTIPVSLSGASNAA